MSLSTDTGYKTLLTISKANQFNEWMYHTIKPYLFGDILEIGSGIGNISRYVLKDGFHLYLSDYDEKYLAILRQTFSQLLSSGNLLSVDLTHPDFKNEFSNIAESFDTIFLLNVLEHISDDSLAIKNCRYLLKAGGKLIILVPAYSFLFSKMDTQLNHCRRYTKKTLQPVLTRNGLTVINMFYFNFLGIAGWWWNKLFNKAEISQGKMRTYNKLVPIAKFLDKLVANKMGLSLINVCKK